jgi:hypothetical protein
MANRSNKFVAVLLAMIGLCWLPACPFSGGGGNGNDNTNTNTNGNDNTNTNANDNDNTNTNTNGNDNTNTNGNDNGEDESDFSLFTDPDTDFSTTRVRDIDGETVRFRISNKAIVYQDGTEYQEGQWTVTGNFVGGVSFQVRFGTEDGVRQAYFTETGPATICDFVVTETAFSIFPTAETVPQE